MGPTVGRAPLAILNEPEKAVCWLAQGESLHENRVADMYLRSGLARIDSVFQKTRRLFNAFERPIGTSSTDNKVWHGYAPYNPGMTEKYLAIFRADNNFVIVGVDGMTPAMRLGFTIGAAWVRGPAVARSAGAAAQAGPPVGEESDCRVRTGLPGMSRPKANLCCSHSAATPAEQVKRSRHIRTV